MKQTEPDMTQLAMLGTLNLRHVEGKTMYLGTVAPGVKEQRRKKNKRARASRMKNRRK